MVAFGNASANKKRMFALLKRKGETIEALVQNSQVMQTCISEKQTDETKHVVVIGVRMGCPRRTFSPTTLSPPC